jgi:hypothetical protein
MALASLTSKRMPGLRFPACHIRTPYPDPWSVFVPEQDGKPVGFVATRPAAAGMVAPCPPLDPQRS